MENAGKENEAQDRRGENAGNEHAAQDCRGGKCGKKKMRTALVRQVVQSAPSVCPPVHLFLLYILVHSLCCFHVMSNVHYKIMLA